VGATLREWLHERMRMDAHSEQSWKETRRFLALMQQPKMQGRQRLFRHRKLCRASPDSDWTSG
jgi:hypothetical protein